MRLAIAVGVILAVLAALASACGGDDKPTSSAGAGGSYFTRLAASFADSSNRSNDATNALNADLNDGNTLDDEKGAIKRFLSTMIEVFDDSTSTMDKLDPPSEARQPHDTFRNKVAEAKTISDGLQRNISDATTEAAAKSVIDVFNERVIQLVDNAQEACRELQGVADAQHAGVDLQCKAA
jgi:hypothetical protein